MSEVLAMKRVKKAGALGAFAAVAFLASGCGATRPSKYYQLAPPTPSSATTAQEQLPISLILGPIYTSHLYREDRIVYSSEHEQMGTYETERWSEPPVEMIRDVLLRKLRGSGRYRDVGTLRSGARGDFVLRGRLYDFKEVTGKLFAGRLSIELEMRDTKTNATVWTHVYNYDEPVTGKDVPAVVAALDRNVQRATNEVAAALDQYFAAHPPVK
ncbi:MAG: membrane integrity-associated transporter subunit PqiC [Acidobacteria bacterium]|nr:membrane integrity-associated transporter subunit PqiC [Acidobacteriota bacterium]MBS1867212.1 membrane integrity-associated transporter subunit PqiC [Acidobacteriota bacterium]